MLNIYKSIFQNTMRLNATDKSDYYSLTAIIGFVKHACKQEMQLSVAT